VRISCQTQDGFNVNIGESCQLELAILVSLAAGLQVLWNPAYGAGINRWAGAYNVLLGIQKAQCLARRRILDQDVADSVERLVVAICERSAEYHR
jgi:hypothetical protein